jgi:membrane-associated phospholipid phosphatase
MKLFKRLSYGLLIFIYFQLGYLWGMQGAPGRASKVLWWIDQALPLIPFFIVFYIAGYLYPFAYALKEKSDDRFRLALIHYSGILTVSFITFKLFPVQMEKTYATGDGVFEKLTYAMQTFDTIFNNFPSLHVSMNAFTYLITKDLLPKKFSRVFLVLTISITLSTMLVKQHLLMDVFGGLGVAGIAYYIFLKLESLSSERINLLTKINLGVLFILIGTQYHFLQIMLTSIGRYLSLFS